MNPKNAVILPEQFAVFRRELMRQYIATLRRAIGRINGLQDVERPERLVLPLYSRFVFDGHQRGFQADECLTTRAGQLQKASETAVLFRSALSDGGMDPGTGLEHDPDPDSGHNSRKSGNNSNFSPIFPT